LKWDEALGHLFTLWTGTYGNVPIGTNAFAELALDSSSHTLSTVGCWALDSTPMPEVGSGLLNIPPSFVDRYLSPGQRFGIGFGGGLASVGAGNSLGPTLRAISPPAENACAPQTNYTIPAGTTLARYSSNPAGPTCCSGGDMSGAHLGCTPSQAPTPPYPAYTSFTRYSVDKYSEDWDPYDGHGWFVTDAAPAMDWYDDGVKSGLVVALQMPAGWVNATVNASPAPTSDGVNITFSIPSTSTHDGYQIEVGNLMWIQTCTPGVESGCDTGNNDHLSFVVVDSVNAVTGAIEAHIVSYDFGNGAHTPVVGGAALLGTLYAHGAPIASRVTLRLQVYDPTQLGEVALGNRAPYDVRFHEEMDLTQWLSGFGSPNVNTVNENGSPTYHGPIVTLADPTAHQIIIVLGNGNQTASAFYVIDVAHD
jgi:hypothetical protein